MITAYYLYSGEDGHSHFKSGKVQELEWSAATSISFRETPSGSTYDWHTAPTTQYVITLSGELEFTTSTGEIFILRTGDILIATDTTGKGHKWRILGTEPWRRAYVKFDDNTNFNFLPD